MQFNYFESAFVTSAEIFLGERNIVKYLLVYQTMVKKRFHRVNSVMTAMDCVQDLADNWALRNYYRMINNQIHFMVYLCLYLLLPMSPTNFTIVWYVYI